MEQNNRIFQTLSEVEGSSDPTLTAEHMRLMGLDPQADRSFLLDLLEIYGINAMLVVDNPCCLWKPLDFYILLPPGPYDPSGTAFTGDSFSGHLSRDDSAPRVGLSLFLFSSLGLIQALLPCLGSCWSTIPSYSEETCGSSRHHFGSRILTSYRVCLLSTSFLIALGCRFGSPGLPIPGGGTLDQCASFSFAPFHKCGSNWLLFLDSTAVLVFTVWMENYFFVWGTRHPTHFHGTTLNSAIRILTNHVSKYYHFSTFRNDCQPF